MVSSITNRLIPAEILTSSHYIFGQIKSHPKWVGGYVDRYHQLSFRD